MDNRRYREVGYLTRAQRNELRTNGLYVYGLRDSDGESYTIEPVVICDNIGYLVTNFDLTPYMENGILFNEDFEALHIEEDCELGK